MTASPLTEKTYTPQHAGQLASVHSFLDAHEIAHGTGVEAQYALVGAAEHDRVEVPAELHQVLVQVVDALMAGRAVTITPRDLTMTTQQAADYLGLSRPTVVKLIDTGEIPAERIDARRRVKLTDVTAYRDRRRRERYDALLAATDDLSPDDDPAVARERLARIRKDRAARRREARREGEL